ncbi:MULTISPECIES: helix-turn-helix transcriptional regulator [unclassified Serratia (in: enterobacteria)]|uniref:helix-turn-helix transcriptional regulator n=1 Tax=unclassified Serratia (in: enterobacteria) TaxID=2647522 RepID=UPI0030767CBB
MAQPLSILIVDANRYFAQGLRLGLQAFFQSRHQAIHLLDETQTEDNIDIIFLGDLITTPPWLYRLHQRNCHPIVFFIKPQGRNPNAFKRGIQCEKCSAGTLYRHQTLFTLLDLLNSVLSAQPQISASFQHDCPCMSPLTPRERDVLRCVYQGMNGRATGAYLDISVKTANAHKQSAMRKLNFRCNQELYQWLLQGGGHYLNERPPAKPHLFTLQSEIAAETAPLLSPPLNAREQNRTYPVLTQHRRSENRSQPTLSSTLVKTV